MNVRRYCLVAVGSLLACSAGLLSGQQQAGQSQGAQSQVRQPQAVNSAAAEPAASDSNSAPAKQAHDDKFIIGNDDVLNINVWNEQNLSHTVPVRSDGKISLPLVGEIQAAGKTPLQLEGDISARLKNYINTPQVSVMVQEIKSQNFNILGQVAKPGTYSLVTSPTVVDAIAAAGGFKDFAKQKSMYVLRHSGQGETRIPFNYKDFIKGKSTSQNIQLEPHDTIVVP